MYDFTPASVRKARRKYTFLVPAALRKSAGDGGSVLRRAPRSLGKRLFSGERRKHDAKTGAAMAGGRYPIENAHDLANAYKDYVRTGRPADVKAHIDQRAKAIGAASPFDKSLHVEVDFGKSKDQPDLEHGLVWGWASIIEKDGKTVTDYDGDRISETELMKAAHQFMANERVSGAMHLYNPDDDKPLKAGEVVESLVFTKELQKVLGVDLGKVGWLIGYRVDDPTIRKAIAAGKLRALSIGGTGVRVPAEG